MFVFHHHIATFRELSTRRFFRVTFGIGAVFVAASLALVAWKLVPLEYGRDVVPLHYNIHFGVDEVGAWWQIFTIPFVGLLLLAVNAAITVFAWAKEEMVSFAFGVATLVFEAFLFLATVFSVLLALSYG